MIVNQDSAMLAVQDPLGNVCKAIGPRPEPAVRRALTVEELASRLAKTGGTAYVCAQVKAVVEPGLCLPAAAINGMRREVLDQLTALRGRREETPLGKYTGPMIYPRPAGRPRSHGAGHLHQSGDEEAAEYAAPVFVCAFVPPGSGPGFLRPDGPPVRLAAVLPR